MIINRTLTTIPDNRYLSWQAELLHHNCKRLGRTCQILIGYTGRPSAHALKLAEKCQAILLQDTRPDRTYSPSIQPYLLARYNHHGPALLVDSDVLFKGFDHFPDAGNMVKASDCGAYLNAAYVDGCDPDLLHHLCTIAHVPPDHVRQRHNAPGAQYILPHLYDSAFWQRIEQNSNLMYKLLAGYKCKIHQVQVWTASMWAIWFELLRMEITGGPQVTTSPALDFCWATDPIHRWEQTNILHMAGVTRGMQGYFHKGDYTERPPWECDLSHVQPGNCSWIYKQAIEDYKAGLNCC